MGLCGGMFGVWCGLGFGNVGEVGDDVWEWAFCIAGCFPRVHGVGVVVVACAGVGVEVGLLSLFLSARWGWVWVASRVVGWCFPLLWWA